MEKIDSRFLGILTVLLFGWGQVAHAQQNDVTFFVIGKHASFNQAAAGAPAPVDYSFFSEIFLTDGGDASAAELRLPTGETFIYADQRQATGGAQDNLLLVSGKRRYEYFEALQSDYPDGEYRVSFQTPSGGIDEAPLVFTGNSLPDAPRIRASQAGKSVCDTIDPELELRVQWSPFAMGGSDPNGLLDDLVFVILTDEDGSRVAHSGRPFEGTSFLTYASSEFIIPADAIQPEHRYRLSVEHAILDDTRNFAGVTAMTTRAVTTSMELVAISSTQLGDARCAGSE